MNLFYTIQIEGEYAYFSEEESRHCTQVLRKKVGDIINFIDGKGGMYEGRIDEASKKKCVVQIKSRDLEYHKRSNYLHIAIAPTKNIARMEWFVEKATELGIDEVTPIFCKRSERKKIRIDRLQKIALAATKQSIKAYLPKINEYCRINDFIRENSFSKKYIAYVNKENDSRHLKEVYSKNEDVCILIGPEGDFTTSEIQLALENGFEAIGLGKSRLRTETAGIAACHIINLINE